MKQTREQIVERVKRRLLRKEMPRVQMLLILLVTGAAGFAVSYLLLHAGMVRMWLRYPLAILLAYCIFLLLLRLWLFLQTRARAPEFDADLDAIDLFHSEGVSGGGSYANDFNLGGAGDFGGGGAGSSWANSASSGPDVAQSSVGGGGGGFFDVDLDEGCLIVLAVAAILGGVIASLYIIYIAPVLLAEILVDGLLVTGLYRSMKGVEQKYWLGTAVRKTLLPALVVALFFSIGGYLLQQSAPAARSIGEVWIDRAP